jgi:hypothetical protein
VPRLFRRMRFGLPCAGCVTRPEVWDWHDEWWPVSVRAAAPSSPVRHGRRLGRTSGFASCAAAASAAIDEGIGSSHGLSFSKRNPATAFADSLCLVAAGPGSHWSRLRRQDRSLEALSDPVGGGAAFLPYFPAGSAERGLRVCSAIKVVAPLLTREQGHGSAPRPGTNPMEI